jgi:hypothetical protein
MASQAVRLPSPARAIFQASRITRPILKRPTPLPLSPAAAASFSSRLSPANQRSFLNSPAPHVRFPSSPTQLVATINTYASDAYDRVPISISPNPVALPGWGERVYSPSIEGFRLSAAPKVFRSLNAAHQSSPVMPGFEDPRSPRLQLPADVTGANAANAIRFAKLAAATQRSHVARIRPLEKAVKTFPRTPYPTAVTQAELENNKGSHLASPSLSVGTAHLHPSSLNRPKKPAPLPLESNSADSDKLSNAFWNSVSIESADEPMVTALEYPESAVEYEEKIDFDIRSASQPPLMFAGADGLLFSPGLPRPHARVEKLRESIQQQVRSPSVNRSSSFIPIARKEVTAPSPNDPFAAFPSFGAVLEQVNLDSTIQYPAPVVQKD